MSRSRITRRQFSKSAILAASALTLTSAGLVRAINDVLHASISYGYRFLNRSAAETSSGTDGQSGSVFNASLDGPFLPQQYFPKITSQFSISYQDAATPGVRVIDVAQSNTWPRASSSKYGPAWLRSIWADKLTGSHACTP